MTVVIWIDWYAYHHARLRSLTEHPALKRRVQGIELVGKQGVHKGMVFREAADEALPLRTLLPGASWSYLTQSKLTILVWRQLNRSNPKMVLVPGYYTLPSIAAALWSKLHGRQTVLMTESTQHDQARTPWKERVKGAVIGLLFDTAISGGKAHRRYLSALGFPADKVARCYDVVDNQFFAVEAARWRREGGRPARAPYFLYVGRFAPEKNLSMLMEAFIGYRRAGGTWDLMLVGGGPEEERLRADAVAGGVTDRVHFAGLKTSKELPQYYAFAECFVLPSAREPWGLVANEAMASGLPVILSDRCGCVEDLLIEGENGFSFSPDTVSGLESRLSAMESLAGDERKRMALRSVSIIAEFAPSKWAEQVAMLAGRAQ